MSSTSVTVDVASASRTLVRWLLTLGAALIYAVMVMKVSLDVWVGSDPTTVNAVFGGVMNSLSLTFGSAFVGWFGISARSASVSYDRSLDGWITGTNWFRGSIYQALVTQLPGAAVLAMFLYLGAGAFAGVTYVFNHSQTPTLLVTVVTAWAAQASAVIASTLSSVLKPDGDGNDSRPASGTANQPPAG